jgi:hypothetical protein
MRRIAPALMALALVAGCGGSGDKQKPTTTAPAAQPAKKNPSRQSTPPYKPSARHAHRPPGSVYEDEIGENVVSATKARILELFGPPASKSGKCLYYRIVGQPKQNWQFCFKGQRMTGAQVAPAR